MQHSIMIPKSRLPDGYDEVLYLQGTGTQYINTAVIPKNNTGMLVTFALDDVITAGVFIGVRQTDGDTRFLLGCSNNKVYYGWNTTAPAELRPRINSNEFHSFGLNYMNSRKVSSDGIDIEGITLPNLSGTKTRSLVMFGYNGPNKTNKREAIFKDVVLTEDDSVAYHFIPCIRKADNEPGMYDIVHNAFHFNAGTGTFITGPKVTPVYQQGLIMNEETQSHIIL